MLRCFPTFNSFLEIQSCTRNRLRLKWGERKYLTRALDGKISRKHHYYIWVPLIAWVIPTLINAVTSVSLSASERVSVRSRTAIAAPHEGMRTSYSLNPTAPQISLSPWPLQMRNRSQIGRVNINFPNKLSQRTLPEIIHHLTIQH